MKKLVEEETKKKCLGICAGVEPFDKLRVNTRQQKCPNGFL